MHCLGKYFILRFTIIKLILLGLLQDYELYFGIKLIYSLNFLFFVYFFFPHHFASSLIRDIFQFTNFAKIKGREKLRVLQYVIIPR